MKIDLKKFNKLFKKECIAHPELPVWVQRQLAVDRLKKLKK